MLTVIILKELLDNLKSLRFILIVLLVMVLMGISAILYIPEYRSDRTDYDRNRNATLSELSEMASLSGALFQVFSYNFQGPWVYKNINHLGFISDGQEDSLPNAFRPSAFKVYGPSKQVRSNILIWRQLPLDWSLIIGVIMSFAALVLVYDSINGERENGTLRLHLANPVARSTVLTGKFLGAFISLALALSIGVLVNLIILLVSGSIPFGLHEWGTIGIAYVFSLVYIAVFILLGLYISSRTSEPSTSLVVGLLCWSLLVVVIPGMGGYIASRVTDLPSSSEMYDEADRMLQEARSSYENSHPELAGAPMSGHWSPGEPLERAFVMSDAWMNVVDPYRNDMINQVALARKATLLSPYACYTACLETIAESGIVHYRNFYRQIRNYRLTMRQHLLDIYPASVGWWGRNDQAMLEKLNQPLDYESIPKFQQKRTKIQSNTIAVMPYLLLLVLFSVVLFAASYTSFNRYDVR